MKAVTAAEMREIDRISINETGIPEKVLMCLAGKAVADHVLSLGESIRRVVVFAGPGNNGGDGYVAAYFLHNAGREVQIVPVPAASPSSEASRLYRRLCHSVGIVERELSEITGPDGGLEDYDCLIDALLGTGSSGPLRGETAGAVKLINDSDLRVVAVDIPSGLGADGEAPPGEAIIADATVTMGLPKISLVTHPGKGYAGKVIVADIGFPSTLTSSDSLKTELVDNEFFALRGISGIESSYRADEDAHKGSRGTLLIVGGFDGMEGAALLAARAAFESGVGLAALLTTDSARAIIAGVVPELITASITPAKDADTPPDGAIDEMLECARGGRDFDAMVIGPGLGRTDFAARVFRRLIAMAAEWGVKKALIDGDGLYHLAGAGDVLDSRIEWILTPHFKEASRLAGISIQEIARHRIKAAEMVARKHGCIVLLKGPASIVTDGTRRYIVTSGNQALATAGSGDVLSGIIGALLLRRLSAIDATATAAWLHGTAADLHCEASAGAIMKSTDLLSEIREAMALLTEPGTIR